MNTIEQLEERIAQLTELVKTGSEAIKSMETALRAAEKERDRLAEERIESEPKFERVKGKEQYYFVNIAYRGFVVTSDTEMGYPLDEASYNSNNYYHTEQHAQKVVDKINFLLKLERLHDTLCPDYKPNWNSGERKYYVFYGHSSKCYSAGSVGNVEYETNVFFPTLEIAEKVCAILNEELKENA